MKYEAYEEENGPKSLLVTASKFHIWVVFPMWLIGQIVTDRKCSGAPFSPLTHLIFPILYSLPFIVHSINIFVIPT